MDSLDNGCKGIRREEMVRCTDCRGGARMGKAGRLRPRRFSSSCTSFVCGGLSRWERSSPFTSTQGEMGKKQGEPDRGGLRVPQNGQPEVGAMLPAGMAGHHRDGFGGGVCAVQKAEDSSFLYVRTVEACLQQAGVPFPISASARRRWSPGAPESACSRAA